MWVLSRFGILTRELSCIRLTKYAFICVMCMLGFSVEFLGNSSPLNPKYGLLIVGEDGTLKDCKMHILKIIGVIQCKKHRRLYQNMVKKEM